MGQNSCSILTTPTPTSPFLDLWEEKLFFTRRTVSLASNPTLVVSTR